MEANRQFLRQEQAASDALFSELNTDIEEEKAGAEQPEARELQPVITHKYRGSQQLSIVEYSTQIYRFDTRGSKEYLQLLAVELSIQPHVEINYLQQSD